MRTDWKVLATAAIAAGTVAAAAPAISLKLAPESRIWVSGTSTVKDFKCTAATFDANLVAPEDATTLELARLVSSADIRIDVAKLDCRNGTMNEHMQKALNAKTAPTIAFRLSRYDITNGEIKLKGELSINGQTKPIELTGKVFDDGGQIRSSASTQINMTEWGVKPPSLMMGTMKVRPMVTIGYEIAVKR